MTNLPITGKFTITAIYGQQGKYWKNGHKGIDFVAPDHRIFATCDGTVYKVAFDADGWGQYVTIIDAKGRRHLFCHLVKGSVKVKKGQAVSRATVIGTMGATGNVSGLHVHYQLQNGNTVIDPTPYLGIPNKKGTYNSADYQIDKEDAMKFKDDSKIPSWAKEAVKKVSDSGYMVGDESGNFNPNQAVTRAELAVVIARIKKL